MLVIQGGMHTEKVRAGSTEFSLFLYIGPNSRF